MNNEVASIETRGWDIGKGHNLLEGYLAEITCCTSCTATVLEAVCLLLNAVVVHLRLCNVMGTYICIYVTEITVTDREYILSGFLTTTAQPSFIYKTHPAF